MHKEDPSPAEQRESSAIFYLGCDSLGRWVVQDADHLRGGLFISEAAAVKFALDENGRRRDMIISVSGVMELDFELTPIPHRPAARQLRRAA